MRYRILVVLSLALAATSSIVQGQASGDWLAKELAMYQAIVDGKFDSFAELLDSSFVAVYPIGVIGRETQIDAVRKEGLKAYSISDFTQRILNRQTVVLAYKLSVANATGSANYWVSSVWRRVGVNWFTVLHTAAPVVDPPTS